MNKEIIKPDITKMDSRRKYRIGTRWVRALNNKFQYVKVDFGVVGKIKGKTIRNIQYMWVPNRL